MGNIYERNAHTRSVLEGEVGVLQQEASHFFRNLSIGHLCLLGTHFLDNTVLEGEVASPVDPEILFHFLREF